MLLESPNFSCVGSKYICLFLLLFCSKEIAMNRNNLYSIRTFLIRSSKFGAKSLFVNFATFEFYCSLSEYHYGFSMYMEPLTKWAQHGPDSNFAIAIPIYFKPSFYAGPIFTTFYWKAVPGLIHVYVVKTQVQKLSIALILYFKSLSWPLEAIKILFAYFNHLIKAKSSLDFNMRTIQNVVIVG